MTGWNERSAADARFEADLARAYEEDPDAFAVRCPNPYCDGTGWVTTDATATTGAYRVPACKVGPHD